MRNGMRLSFLAVCALGIAGCCFLRGGLVQRVLPVTYYLHSYVSSNWVTALNSATTTWNGVLGLLRNGGYSAQATPVQTTEGVNSIFVTNFLRNTQALAETTLSRFDPPCGVTDTDMGINPNIAWSFTTPFSFQYDAQSTVLHEFGHYAHLLHVTCPRTAVMYEILDRGEVRRALRACDALGMRLSHAVTECYTLTGICFPSFSFLQAFDDTDDEDQGSTDPFDEYEAEMIQIWKGDATLRANADSVGDFYSRMLDDWRKGGTLAYGEYFTSARYQEIDSKIISRMYTSASTGLRAKLNGVRTNLQGKVGRRLSAIFTTDTEQYEPAGGYREPGGGPPPV
ncbi:MAG TPA: hypothetical protein VGG03_12505 [Thermoanaerobaculia bacterium]|jgi:hypothetical protein